MLGALSGTSFRYLSLESNACEDIPRDKLGTLRIPESAFVVMWCPLSTPEFFTLPWNCVVKNWLKVILTIV